MPADIRSFFAPKGGAAPAPKKPAPPPPAKPVKRGRKVVESDEEEEVKPAPAKKPISKPAPKTKKEEPIDDASAYFASSGKNKITRTGPVRAAPPVKKNITMKKLNLNDDDAKYLDDDDEDYGDDIFKSEYGKAVEDEPVKRRKKNDDMDMDDYKDDEGDEDEDMDDFVDDEEEEVKPKGRGRPAKASVVKVTPKKATPAAAAPKGRKRKSITPETDDDEEDEQPKPKKKATAAAKRKTPVKRKEVEEIEESESIKEILSSVPTVRPPTPPPRDDTKKFNYHAYKQKAPAPPPTGTKDIPTGAENCLAGLTFVFTGNQQSISRDDAVELVKRYGGKVTGGPSRKTSYVVVGSEAGPKKLETIRELKLKTIDEDGLFALISKLPAHGGDSTAAQAAAKKAKDEEKKIQEIAKEMKPNISVAPGKEAKDPNSQLWTVKYSPSTMKEICGNKGQVDKLQKWLQNWPRNLKKNFKMPGPDGSGLYRAVMIHGPPGVGKTTAAHLVAKLEGYDVLESNASDTRSKKLLDTSLKGVLDNRSLMGYFNAGDKKVDAAKQKIVLIMDEVDGMSGGDRGGVGQMAAICRKTQIPVICICNDRRLPKMKPFDHVTYDLQFRRPTATEIRTRMMTICYREGLKLSPQAIDSLTEGSHSDIRQIINMLSTFGVSGKEMSFDESKNMASAWQKHVVLKPWDIAQQLLQGHMFAPTSKKTLNDKIELYFNDHEFSYLMIQDNYLKPNPQRASNYQGPERRLKLLELADKAAESISDGDLVDAMIHGPQQHWSMMPVHAVFSTVAPSSFMSGSYGGGHMQFSAWFGQNSKQQKLNRYVKEIQSHMRLRCSADRHEVRQFYVPMFWQMLCRQLEREGKDAVDGMIELMDDYFLTKEDYDAIIELGVGPLNEDTLKVPTAAKSAFTRAYNAASHPMPFMKASNVIAPKGKAAKKEQPDLEEAIEEDEDELEMVEDAEDAVEEEDADLSKDKYVKQAKPKAKGKAPAKGKGKAKKAVDDDEEEDEDEDFGKGKGKGKAPAKSRGRAKK
ncbi:hypothetical protein TWF569_006962 [Orbilia oligospora]|uniref:Replication factor C subunit 1 n=1 Tax=Orbilia oligospora TaxID=2813651 RepID=A0A7C8N5M1_ORBOL|nr:hypothetical protein TWF102_011940 [Orbilia oligospora]KAF3117568.1 hypothetical protein TWF103_006294 [Orbilia oligospora]KAF3144762.1 hypothetical protein TWF569_006962 [Orbilia oligospora]